MPVKLFSTFGGGNTSPTSTDANGRYSIKWTQQNFPGGDQRAPYLIAQDTNRNLAVARELEEDTTTLDLQLEPGLVIVGQVQGEDGKPLTNASVRLILWTGNSGMSFGEPRSTDSNGRFEINGLPPSCRYSLDANAKGHGSANRQIAQDETTNRVELEPMVLRLANLQLAGQVLDSDDKPFEGANVYMYGQGQPQTSVRSDKDGWFKFDEVCEGPIQISANAQRTYGNARAQGGDTNVVINLRSSSSGVSYSDSSASPRRPSLKGKPLPDLATVKLTADSAPAGKPVLICVFDVEQRPSRSFVRLLAEQNDALAKKGVVVIGVQGAVVTDDVFNEWKGGSAVPFAVGRVMDKSDKATKWADTESLPLLILSDAQHKVVAEGFPFEEIDKQVSALPK